MENGWHVTMREINGVNMSPAGFGQRVVATMLLIDFALMLLDDFRRYAARC